MRTASTQEDINAIKRSDRDIAGHHLIVGGRSGSGFGLAKVLASEGEGVLFTHSGNRKPELVQSALHEIREAFANSGVDADPETEVITIGGDASTAEHRDQIRRAAYLWVPEGQPLSSLTLSAARGTEPQGLGVESNEPDPDYARRLNVDGVLGVYRQLFHTATTAGRPILERAVVLYPASTASHDWENLDPEQLKLYGAVGPTKREAEVAMRGEVAHQMRLIGGRAIVAVMGLIEGTLVAKGIKRAEPTYLERGEVTATTIDVERAGKGQAEIIYSHRNDVPNGSVVHILPNTIEVEKRTIMSGLGTFSEKEKLEEA